MKRSVVGMASIALAGGLAFLACQQPTLLPVKGSNNTNGDGSGTTTTTIASTTGTVVTGGLSADLKGAKALVTKSASNSSKGMGRGFHPRAINDSPLVKILEDGSVANVLQTDGSVQLPDIDFLAASPTGEVYVYFKSPLYLPTTQGAAQVSMQFLKISADNTIEIVEAQCWIQKFNWSWGAGQDQKPVVFTDDGAIYYTTWDNSSSSIVLKRYANKVAKALTQPIANMSIEAFFTDGTNLFYVGRNNTSQNKAYYLRMVRPDGTYKNAIYQENGQSGTWIRAVKRSGTDIILHGWGLPDPNNKDISYNGLIRLSRDAADTFTATLIVGNSNNASIAQGGNLIKLKLNPATFTDAAGKVDTANLESIARQFFVGGVEPAGIDFFKVVSWDRNATEYAVDFKSSDERYFWYLLLKDYAGFDKNYLLTTQTDSWNGNFWNLFGNNNGAASVESSIVGALFNQNGYNYSQIPPTDPMVNKDGTIDPRQFIAKFNLGPQRKAYFSSLAAKSGVQIPATIQNNFDSDAKRELYVKNYFDTYFDYVPATKSTTNFDWYSHMADGVQYFCVTPSTPLGFNATTGTFNLATFDLVVKNAVQANGNAAVSASFARKSNGGVKFDPNTSMLTYDEVYSQIEWQYQNPSSTATYDKVGVLGNYRVLTPGRYNENPQHFYINFYDGIPVTYAALSGNGVNGSIGNGFLTYSYMSNTYTYGVVTTNFNDQSAFTSYLQTFTNASLSALKDLGGGTNLYTLMRATPGATFANDEVRSQVTYYTTFTAGQGLVASGLGANLWYKVTASGGDEANFIRNFCSAYPTPQSVSSYTTLPGNNGGFDGNTYYKVLAAERWSKADISTLDKFVTAVKAESSYGSLVPKSVGGKTLDTATMPISSDEIWKSIVWKADENSASQTYPKMGALGPYRIVDTNANDQNNFIYNFFTWTPKTYDFATVDGTNGDLNQLANMMPTEQDWNGSTNTIYPLYSQNGNSNIYSWKSAFLKADGTVDQTKVLALLGRFSSSPAMLLSNPNGFSEADYAVLNATTGLIDRDKTQKAICSAAFTLSKLPVYPGALSSGVWNYSINPDWGNTGDYSFQNLQSFSIDKLGQIFGIFGGNTNGATSSKYALLKLYDGSQVVQDKIKTDMTGSSLTIEGSFLYYAGSDASGTWTLSRLGLSAGSIEEPLIPVTEQMELYKFTPSDLLNKVFITGSSSKTGNLLIGYIDMAKTVGRIVYQNAAGVSASSDMEIYTGN